MTSPTAIVRSITTSTSRYEERGDGIVVQRLLTTRTQTLAEARENTAAFSALAADRAPPALIDMRIARALEPGARDHYADPEVASLSCAVALLVASPTSRAMGNALLSSRSFTTPLQVFTDEADAIAWLLAVRPRPG